MGKKCLNTHLHVGFIKTLKAPLAWSLSGRSLGFKKRIGESSDRLGSHI